MSAAVVAHAATMMLSGLSIRLAAQENSPAVAIDARDIGGVITGPKVLAGVWVIAETTDLPSRMSKSVVPDDRGR